MKITSEETNFIDAMTAKYNGYAYMYAEYPNKSYWKTMHDQNDYVDAINRLTNYWPEKPSQLYIHLPFCPNICHFCSCYRLKPQNYGEVKDFLFYIIKELQLLKQIITNNSVSANFKTIHLGGGSPSFLKEEEFTLLRNTLNELVPIASLDEFAIEIDPRHVDIDRLEFYHTLGINRISFGIQDFDPIVQKAVNRLQPINLVERLLTPRIRSLFKSISFDVLYGLPKQTLDSFMKTIDKVIELNPSRVVLLSFNFSPESNENQRNIQAHDLPGDKEKLEMFYKSTERLLAKNYVKVGLEHFSSPDDNLATIWKSGDFNWNMSGYHKGNANKIIGIGPGSCSRITDDYYFQNIKPLDQYKAYLLAGRLPIHKGYKLTEDDLIRREVTIQLRSRLVLDIDSIENRFKIRFDKYFNKEITFLDEFEKDGIIRRENHKLVLTDLGAPFTSFVCMVFDAYCNKNERVSIC